MSEGPFPGAGLRERRLRGAVNDIGVVAVDDDAIEVVSRGAVGRRVFDGGHLGDRRVFHIKIILAHEDDRQLPDHGEVQRLMESADIGGAVAEEAHRHVVLPLVLRAQRRPAGDRQMRADDGVGAHYAMLDRGQMHRAALAAHQPVVALHQFPQDLLDGDAACERMRVPAIGAETEVAGPHRRGEACRDRFLAEREMARALDQILQKQLVGLLLRLANDELRTIHLQPLLLADIVVDARRLGGGCGCGLIGHLNLGSLELERFRMVRQDRHSGSRANLSRHGFRNFCP